VTLIFMTLRRKNAAPRKGFSRLRNTKRQNPLNPKNRGHRGSDEYFATRRCIATPSLPEMLTTVSLPVSGNPNLVCKREADTPISIYKLQGKIFMTRTAMPNESISVAHLPKGVYVVKAGGEMVKVVR